MKKPSHPYSTLPPVIVHLGGAHKIALIWKYEYCSHVNKLYIFRGKLQVSSRCILLEMHGRCKYGAQGWDVEKKWIDDGESFTLFNWRRDILQPQTFQPQTILFFDKVVGSL